MPHGIKVFIGFAIWILGGGGGLFIARENAFFGGLIIAVSIVAGSIFTGIGDSFWYAVWNSIQEWLPFLQASAF